MNTVLLSIHILVCLALIGIVLIQGGKGAEAGASFGGGGEHAAMDKYKIIMIGKFRYGIVGPLIRLVLVYVITPLDC